MHHKKYNELRTLVNANMAVLLTGERGTGKTSLCKDVAKGLKLKFHSISMTRQTTMSHLLGFISVNGTYIPSLLRNAVEHGGLMLLDEIDASDPNAILCLNTIENGYLTFPDKIVEVHKDFRVMATSNPQDDHRSYTGRAKLDAATLDRFDVIEIDIDENLERSLVSVLAYKTISLARECLCDVNSSIYISMRDLLRYQKRTRLGILDGVIEKLLGGNLMAIEKFNERYAYITVGMSGSTSVEELWSNMVENKSENNT